MIDSEDGYGKKKVPEISGKGRVDSSEDSDEVVLICSYGSLGEVRAMVAGRLELGGDLMHAKEVKERLGKFIVSGDVGER